jgi:putative ABC transport system permease protein
MKDVMLANYITIALRTLRKRPGYTIIHVLGLAVGLAACLLIGRYVVHAWSYDRFHADADAIHRVTQARQFGTVQRTAVTPPPLAPALQASFPAVENTVRLVRQSMTVEQGGDAFRGQTVVTADSSFFGLFSFPLQQGRAADVLAAPYSIVLTASAAARYFGTTEAVGRSVTLQGQGATGTYTVTGVAADVPATSHIQFDAVASLATVQESAPQFFNWGSNMFYTYVRLTDGADPAALEAQFDALVEQNLGEEYVGTIAFALQPLTDIHLHSDLTMDLGGRGSATLVLVLAAIAVLVLVVACINFVNLATARAMERAREVGVRKTMGAWRGALVGQFLTEAILITLGATGGAVVLAWLGLPLLNALTGQAFTGAVLMRPAVALGLVGVAVLVGLGAGSYPAFVLAGFRPARVLQASPHGGPGGTRLRQGLTVAQFAVTIGLIAATIVVYQQFDYIRTKDLGYDADRLLSAQPPKGAVQVDRLHTLWQDAAGVEAVTAVSSWMGDLPTRTVRPAPDAEERLAVRWMDVAPGFTRVTGVQVLAGRGFRAGPASDSLDAALINATAARALGWRAPIDAVGETVFTGDTAWRVVGVVDDFHYNALYSTVDPLLIRARPEALRQVLVRTAPGQAEQASAALAAGWQAVVADRPLDLASVRDQRAQLYQTDRRLGQLVGLLAGLTVFIACLGLFGLAVHTTAQRTKEIGVRKVLGATVPQVVAMLSADVLKLIGIALVLAVPLAYIALQHWLADFAYRTDLSAGAFLVAGALALTVALLTVSTQTIRAATADPVNALRSA